MNILRFARLAVPAAALAVAACQPAATSSPPLAGAKIGGPFSLVNQDGRTVTDRDFAGKYRIMYFGYTYCPDVCPTDAPAIGKGVVLLAKSDPDLAKREWNTFFSVDPERDTPKVLKSFVCAFSPQMIGLTGTPDAIAAVAKAYAVAYMKQPTPSGYLMLVNHSRATYLMSPDGKPLALLPSDKGPQAVADEIKRWAT